MLHDRYAGKRRRTFDDPDDFRKVFKLCTHVKEEKDKYYTEYKFNLEK